MVIDFEPSIKNLIELLWIHFSTNENRYNFILLTNFFFLENLYNTQTNQMHNYDIRNELHKLLNIDKKLSPIIAHPSYSIHFEAQNISFSSYCTSKHQEQIKIDQILLGSIFNILRDGTEILPLIPPSICNECCRVRSEEEFYLE